MGDDERTPNGEIKDPTVGPYDIVETGGVPIAPIRIYHNGPGPACGADISAACSWFRITLPTFQPQLDPKTHMLKIAEGTVEQYVLIQPLACPVCHYSLRYNATERGAIRPRPQVFVPGV